MLSILPFVAQPAVFIHRYQKRDSIGWTFFSPSSFSPFSLFFFSPLLYRSIWPPATCSVCSSAVFSFLQSSASLIKHPFTPNPALSFPSFHSPAPELFNELQFSLACPDYMCQNTQAFCWHLTFFFSLSLSVVVNAAQIPASKQYLIVGSVGRKKKKVRLLFIICHKACGVSLGSERKRRGKKEKGKQRMRSCFYHHSHVEGGEKKLSASGLVEHMTSLFSFNFLASASSRFCPEKKEKRQKKFERYQRASITK